MLGCDAPGRLIQARAPVARPLGAALFEGMRMLGEEGIEKVLAGITDLRQVRRVCVR